jgi:ADP-ribose pyrophosphatase YjhB (NUDIX family)
VGVGVVVWRGDQVLLIRRARPPRAGQWGIPGGAQELGETLFEAARREILEETGLTIRPTGIVTAIDGIVRDGQGRVEYHYTLVEVSAEWVAGEATARSDVDAARWVAPRVVRALVDWEETVRVIELAAAMRRSV